MFIGVAAQTNPLQCFEQGGFQVSSKIFHYEKLDATTIRLLARREMNYDVKDILVLGEVSSLFQQIP